jgi:hypothetical protein
VLYRSLPSERNRLAARGSVSLWEARAGMRGASLTLYYPLILARFACRRLPLFDAQDADSRIPRAYPNASRFWSRKDSNFVKAICWIQINRYTGCKEYRFNQSSA